MGMKNVGKFAMAMLAIIGIMLMMSSFLFIDSNEKDKKVPCYDRYSNQIVGETCIDKADGFTDEFVAFIFVGWIFFFIGMIGNAISFDDLREPLTNTNFFGFEVVSE